MNLDPQIVRMQVDRLFADCPELQDDERLRRDMLEGQTDLIALLRFMETRRQEVAAHVKALDATIEEIKTRRGRFERIDEANRRFMFNMLQWANLRKLELPEATLSIRAGMPKVLILDEAIIPDEFCRIRREPDKIKIKAALETGNVPGTALSNAEQVLAVRVK